LVAQRVEARTVVAGRLDRLARQEVDAGEAAVLHRRDLAVGAPGLLVAQGVEAASIVTRRLAGATLVEGVGTAVSEVGALIVAPTVAVACRAVAVIRCTLAGEVRLADRSAVVLDRCSTAGLAACDRDDGRAHERNEGKPARRAKTGFSYHVPP